MPAWTDTMDPRHALDTAVTAAREAGAILLEDFTRAGGPEGSGGHADADDRAEERIRSILLEAFPETRYRGEETGTGGASDGPLWLVDPNDGTRAYLEGFRGSAVSIALISDGRPVLGVVFAYAAPDNDGDLFAWSEATGPLLRNGEPVEHTAPDELDASHTVAVSQRADCKPTCNAGLVSPARYRCIPGIAYRLALTACGETAAAVSLNGPGGWDLAGGHALLRAAGADILDQAGEPLVYGRDGDARCGRCFAGSHEVAKALSEREWDLVFCDGDASVEPELCMPARTRIFGGDGGRLARAQGCLLGQIAGDNLGGLVEFARAETIAKQYPDGPRRLVDGGLWSILAGQPTDDSELALLLARSVIEADGYDQETAARAYAWWFSSFPYDIGNTTSAALSPAAAAVQLGRPVAEAAMKKASVESQANGALMRISPLGVFGHGLDPDVLAEAARDDAAITHPHPVCRDANALFAVSIAYAVAEGPDPRSVYDHACGMAGTLDIHPDVRARLDAAESTPPDDYGGWVLNAFQNAYYRLLHSASPEEGVVETVRCGQDTDTNAAIAGALLGAVHGRDAVPPAWTDRVLTCRPSERIETVHRPRPPRLWPVDALTLAERLLILL